MLDHITPQSGPMAGNRYDLPLTKEPPIPIPPFRDTARTIGRGLGGWPSSGTAPAFLGPVIIPATFVLWETQVSLTQAQGRMGGPHSFAGAYGSGVAAVKTALADLNLYLFQGGLVTLVSIPPAGYQRGAGGAVITSRTCTARVIGTLVPAYSEGETRCEVEVQLECLRGIWTNSDGSWDYIVDV